MDFKQRQADEIQEAMTFVNDRKGGDAFLKSLSVLGSKNISLAAKSQGAGQKMEIVAAVDATFGSSASLGKEAHEFLEKLRHLNEISEPQLQLRSFRAQFLSKPAMASSNRHLA
jgi:hypothetical protein